MRRLDSLIRQTRRPDLTPGEHKRRLATELARLSDESEGNALPSALPTSRYAVLIACAAIIFTLALVAMPRQPARLCASSLLFPQTAFALDTETPSVSGPSLVPDGVPPLPSGRSASDLVPMTLKRVRLLIGQRRNAIRNSDAGEKVLLGEL